MKKRILIMIMVLTIALSSCSEVQSQVGSDSVATDVNQVETEAKETEKDTPEKNEPKTISIIMAGDVLLHTRVTASGDFDGEYNFDHLFENCKDIISSADLAIVNQEIILGGTELGISGYPSFNGPFEVADSLVDAGFDVVLHATNHALDRGKKGIISCLTKWEEAYPQIEIAGIYKTEEDSKEICMTEVNGAKIAILNYTYGMNGIPLPSDMPYCVDMLTWDREEKIRNDIARAREMADIVIVAPHWGSEYTHVQGSDQKKWTSVFFECGVDLVIGTHPHVVQPYEIIQSEEHTMAVYYSIGNYVNATEQWGSVTQRMLGALADVEFTLTDGEWTLSKADAIPIVSHVETDRSGELTVYPLDEYTSELAAENEIKAQDPKFSLDALKKINDDVLSKKEEVG